MAKLLNQVLKNFQVKNAPSGGTSKGGGMGGSFNRDPKATQVKRVGYQLIEGGGGGGRDNWEAPEADFAQITTAIKRDSYLTQTVMKYEELIFKSGWSLQGKNEQALEYLKLRLAMMAIATSIPTEELFQGIASDIVRYSNSFIAKARVKNGAGLPPGLSALPVPPAKAPVGGYFRLPPNTVTISRDPNGTILGYRQEVDGGGDPVDFRPEDIIHIKVNVPVGVAFGDPWLAPVLEDVRLLRKVEENAALLLYRHIFPLLTYQVGLAQDGYEATDEELEDLRAIIEDLPTDGAIVLPERHKVEAVNINAIDGKPYLEYFENRVFSGLGMSAVDFGRGDTANRNTADAMTGIKADRVKGWQTSISTQIDKYLIEEILVEGGFDPLVNAEFDVDFIFNEIELERQIAKESHEIFKFNNNVQTWEETRTRIGHEPVGDEARLHFQMIGIATAEATAALKPSGEAANKNQPTNQNGTRSGPKSSTESLKENVFDKVSISKAEELASDLQNLYLSIEKDTLEQVLYQAKRQSLPLTNTKNLLSSVHFGKDQMLSVIERALQDVFDEGMINAKREIGRERNPKFKKDLAMQTVEGYVLDGLDNLQERIKSLLAERLESEENIQQTILAVKGIFESLRFKMNTFAKSTVARTYNYAYVLTLMSYEEEYASVHYEGHCKSCTEKAKEKISLKQLSSMDEIAVFYKIPPWHPNCECEVQSFKGGEM